MYAYYSRSQKIVSSFIYRQHRRRLLQQSRATVLVLRFRKTIRIVRKEITKRDVFYISRICTSSYRSRGRTEPCVYKKSVWDGRDERVHKLMDQHSADVSTIDKYVFFSSEIFLRARYAVVRISSSYNVDIFIVVGLCFSFLTTKSNSLWNDHHPPAGTKSY